MSLQDWDAIAGILGFLLLVGTTLAGLVGWFRRRRDALPEPPKFGVAGDYTVDPDGVRWVTAWVQNMGARAYLHDVCCEEGISFDSPPEKCPEVARDGELESLPRKLRSLSKRELRHKEVVFKPLYLSAGKKVRFYVFCPPDIDQMKLVATMSIGRRGYRRCTFSAWFDVPNADGLREIEPVYFPA
ncbi:hypothetical protein [uncultured Actinomyces sp.]|uniref:hypothetical protein n=1 Tax=uncultured Actinomyces sp. TaxID=249061 RepID=UPI00288BFDBE|nr:hypothetical protein [uncultured Actinomyces sp.]